jgi:hypothetical protein
MALSRSWVLLVNSGMALSAPMSIFQCLTALVAELNRVGNRLFLANVTMPERQPSSPALRGETGRALAVALSGLRDALHRGNNSGARTFRRPECAAVCGCGACPNSNRRDCHERRGLYEHGHLDRLAGEAS